MSDNEYQSRFITYNKSITPVQDVNSGGSCSGVQAGDKQKLSVLSAQFCYESKIALKNSLLIVRKQVIFILENAMIFFNYLQSLPLQENQFEHFSVNPFCIFLSLYTPVCECMCFLYLKNGEIWVLILILSN